MGISSVRILIFGVFIAVAALATASAQPVPASSPVLFAVPVPAAGLISVSNCVADRISSG